jgi:hypothetical protein
LILTIASPFWSIQIFAEPEGAGKEAAAVLQIPGKTFTKIYNTQREKLRNTMSFDK